MKGGHVHNSQHFTGKKKGIKCLKKKVVRKKQEPHKNKYKEN